MQDSASSQSTGVQLRASRHCCVPCKSGRGQAELPTLGWESLRLQNETERASMPFCETNICRSQFLFGARPLRPNVNIFTLPKTVHAFGIRTLRPLMPTASSVPNVDVYARTSDAIEEAKQILLKDDIVTAKGVQTPTSVRLHFPPVHHSGAAFNAQFFLSRLTTATLGCTLLTAAELPSTQTLLHDNAGKIPNGTVCVADRQVMGKGRGHNTWESPAGCLMFSLVTHLKLPGVRLPFVQYVASLAIVEAVQEQAREHLQGHPVDVRIKWPNDIYGDRLKIGGILCQSAYRDQAFHVVIGAGINLGNREPTTCIDALVEAQQAKLNLPGSLPPIAREALLPAILNNLERMLNVLVRDGFGPLESAYLDAWLHSGQQVVLEEEEGGISRKVPLTVQGLTPSGYLKAVDQGGTLFELHPDGNSLDFFKGLVRKKIVK